MTTPYGYAINALAAEFALPAPDRITQDWVLEMPGEYRTLPYFERYLAGLSDELRPPEERGLLMELILHAANGQAKRGTLSARHAIVIEREILTAPDLYAPLIASYECRGVPLEDCFPLTPLVRRVAFEMFRERLLRLVRDIEGQIPGFPVGHVADLARVGEVQLALEDLCSNLGEVGVGGAEWAAGLRTDTCKELANCCEMQGLEPSYWSHLVPSDVDSI